MLGLAEGGDVPFSISISISIARSHSAGVLSHRRRWWGAEPVEVERMTRPVRACRFKLPTYQAGRFFVNNQTPLESCSFSNRMPITRRVV